MKRDCGRARKEWQVQSGKYAGSWSHRNRWCRQEQRYRRNTESLPRQLSRQTCRRSGRRSDPPPNRWRVAGRSHPHELAALRADLHALHRDAAATSCDQRNVGRPHRVSEVAGFDLIIVETAGIGQSDSEIVDLVDFSMYVMTSEYGAASQLEKIDMLDFADLIVLNKYDKRGAEDALRDIRKQWKRNHVAFKTADEEFRSTRPSPASSMIRASARVSRLCERLVEKAGLDAADWTADIERRSRTAALQRMIPGARFATWRRSRNRGARATAMRIAGRSCEPSQHLYEALKALDDPLPARSSATRPRRWRTAMIAV